MCYISWISCVHTRKWCTSCLVVKKMWWYFLFFQLFPEEWTDWNLSVCSRISEGFGEGAAAAYKGVFVCYHLSWFTFHLKVFTFAVLPNQQTEESRTSAVDLFVLCCLSSFCELALSSYQVFTKLLDYAERMYAECELIYGPEHLYTDNCSEEWIQVRNEVKHRWKPALRIQQEMQFSIQMNLNLNSETELWKVRQVNAEGTKHKKN